MSQNETDEEYIVHTVCNSHCGGNCEIKVHVKSGKIVRLEAGDSEDPEHRACARGRSYRQRVYAPDRLLYPLKRTGKRGAGEFSRVSWDEALDTVAGELKRVRDTYGNSAIFFFCSMADAFTIHHVQSMHKLLCMFGGYTSPWGAISEEGNAFSSGITYGLHSFAVPSIERRVSENYPKAKLIILWASNPVTTNQGSANPLSLTRAKEQRTKIICVDPRYTDSAAVFADKWIPIRPSTDVPAFLAMAYVIITENLHDKSFIDKYTFGFDKFSDYVLGLEDGVKKTPEWAETICGIPTATIADLAREYATTKPALLLTSISAGRTAFGEQYHRAASTLMAITGNISIPEGGGAGSSPAIRAVLKSARIASPPNPVEQDMPPRWNALPFRSASVNSSARVNVSSLADAILKGKAGGYPTDIKLLWLSNNAYLNQLGNANNAAKAFQDVEFILVTEQFMTPTAKFADIVFPVCTYMERNDFYAGGAGAQGNRFAIVGKVIEPLGESKSQLQICEALAPKLGINDYNDKSDEELVKSIVAKISEQIEFPDYDSLKEQGMYQAKLDKPVAAPKKESKQPEPQLFPTPSGKIEIYSQVAAEMNHPMVPPIPRYIEPPESLNDPLVKKYPLQLTTPHYKWRAHSQFHNIPWLRDLQTQAVTINTVDANSRGIMDGDMVRVFNNRGEVMIPAHVTERIMPGVVALREGAWYEPDENGVDRGGCPNTLTTNIVSPGGAFNCNTCLVQVEKAGE